MAPSGSADVFCGDTGASLTDTQGRSFDGTDPILVDGSSDCGDDVQPGLAQGGYLVDFKLPADAQPATISLWCGIDQDEANAATWPVGGE